ncbi:MAG: hypothetical protein AAFV38_08300, partial [Pseudomonadota bacterium]
MPSYGFLAHTTPMVCRALKAARTRFDMVAGLDTGAWLLAAAGLLGGQKATIHWDETTRFAAGRYAVADHDPVVQDRDIGKCFGETCCLVPVDRCLLAAAGLLGGQK